MIGVVLALLIVPLAAGITCAVLPLRAVRAAAAVTVASGIACFGLVLALVPAAAHHDLDYLSYLRADAVSVIFLLATGLLVRGRGGVRGRLHQAARRTCTPGGSTPG